MGIQGLLPLLKSIMATIHIKDMAGCCVAVDTYSWLHKGALSCSVELCKGLPTSRHIDYCMHRVNLLRHYGIKPILVFDGGFLPMKVEQENKRGKSRNDNLARATEHESNGNSAAAYECYQKAVDITPEIAYQLIQVLKQENVDYVVAPYEADAQMTFLAISKQVDAVITEDSDLIPFGCPRIIYKLDKFGQGVEFQYSKLQNNRDISFAGFTNQMVLEMCILSGCDYLPSLPGMGLKRAHALIKKFKTFDKVIKHLRYSTMAVPPTYEESFNKAISTFKYQRVYDPISEDMVHLSEITGDLADDLDFVGPLLPRHLVAAIARGEVDPITKLPFEGGNARATSSPEGPYQLKDFRPENGKKKLDLPVQKNNLSNYFCFASLEAKRNFRAPRVSPKVSEPSSPCLRQGDASKSNDSDVEGSQSNSSERTPEQNVVLQSTRPIHRPCLEAATKLRSTFSQKFEENKPSDESHHDTALRSSYYKTVEENALGGKSSSKVVVRSSYFRKNSSKETKSENQNAEQQPKNGDLYKDARADISLETASPQDENCCYRSDLKRKMSPIKSVSKENSFKHARTESSTLDGKFSPEDFAYRGAKPDGAKFGCNIAHLDSYTAISEKSLEKFASAISSCEYKSTGSRASGLRAPLKDLRNTDVNRSPAVLEISKFAYIPKTKRPQAVKSQRR